MKYSDYGLSKLHNHTINTFIDRNRNNYKKTPFFNKPQFAIPAFLALFSLKAGGRCKSWRRFGRFIELDKGKGGRYYKRSRCRTC